MMAACSQQVLKGAVELHVGFFLRGHAWGLHAGFVARECCDMQSLLSSGGRTHARGRHLCHGYL